MRVTESSLPMRASVAERAGGQVNLWTDSLGDGARQIGVLLFLAVAMHLAAGLLPRP